MDTSPQKVILVTGGAGFVGSHLCERLVNDGHAVISLDNYFTGSSSNHVPGVEYRTGHTKDIAHHVPEVPDIVYHLGEYARTEKSFEDIEMVWDLNKLGTVGVLEFWRRTKCKLVYAGSSTKFADGGNGRDQSPYAWSKASNTELVVNYGAWFGLTYAITYFYNVYGPREMSGSYGTLISIFSRLVQSGQPLTVVSPGTQVRNFTHVNDIVEGLIRVGEEGEGDGFGIGADEGYSVLAVADMFGGEIIMLPGRQGNRMLSPIDTERTKTLGWKQKHRLRDYIADAKIHRSHGKEQESRVLVFSTTFFPDVGKAEEALGDLMKTMPNVQFDVITTKFSARGKIAEYPHAHVHVHRVGFGNVFDKYLLPFLGARVARTLQRKHTYLFSWALFASYAALAAVFSRYTVHVPLLITIADQKFAKVPLHVRLILGHILGKADQVYVEDTEEARAAISFSQRTSLIRAIGGGDAFANQIRVAYSALLRARIKKYEI